MKQTTEANPQFDNMVLKTNVKHEVYQKTVSSFALLKEVLKDLADSYGKLLKDKVDESLLPAF